MNPLLTLAIHAAKSAGAEIQRLYATTDFECKDDGSPVTIADTRANEILIEHLSETGITILSEESPGISLPYSPQMWIIDPLDGTRDFIEKTGDFVVMVGLLQEGRPVLGVVYAPMYDTLYYAESGMGAWKMHGDVIEKLSVSSRTEDLRFVRSIHHATHEMQGVAKRLNATFVPRGSMGIKAGVVSEGDGDFFYTRGKVGEWDVCAPEIITLEAGGAVTDCFGNPLFYGTADHRIQNGILFSNNLCHGLVIQALKADHDQASEYTPH
jgi:3'(2'), 5'-bisphosphate nucleotidase